MRDGRVHVAQRGTDRPVLVFDRDGRLVGSWGEGAAGRAALHQCRARRLDPGGRPRRPPGAALRRVRPAPAGAGQAALAVARRAVQPSDGGGAGGRRRDLRRRRLRQFQRPSLRRRRHADRDLGRAGHGTGRRSPRRTPSGSIAPARCWSATARTTACRCSTATAPSSPNGATSIIRCRSGWTSAAWSSSPTRSRASACSAPDGKLIGRCRGAINGAHGLAGDAEGNLYLAELPPQEITKLERLN